MSYALRKCSSKVRNILNLAYKVSELYSTLFVQDTRTCIIFKFSDADNVKLIKENVDKTIPVNNNNRAPAPASSNYVTCTI